MAVLCPFLHRHDNITSLVLMHGTRKRNCLLAQVRVKKGNSSIPPRNRGKALLGAARAPVGSLARSLA